MSLSRITGLALTVLTALATIWVGPAAMGDLPTKIAQSFIVVLSLALDPAKLKQFKHGFLAVATLAGVVLSFVALKIPASSAAAAIVPVILGVLTKLQATFQAEEKKEGGFVRPSLALTLAYVSFIAIVILVMVYSPKKAKADDSPQLGTCITPTICVQPAVAVSAFQLNLKTLDYERVSLAAGYGITYKTATVNLGAAIYGGVGISKSTPNAPQASVLFNIADVFAIGPGVQTFIGANGDRIWQGLLTLALNYNLGGSPTYLQKVVRQERAKRMLESEF